MSAFLRWLDTNDVAFAVAVGVLVWLTLAFWLWCIVRSGARCPDLRPTPPRLPLPDDDEPLPAWRGAHPPECECVACEDRLHAEALLARYCGATRELVEDV